MQKICRCCNKIINCKPILEYKNLPEKVQGFDRIGESPTDKAIDLDIYQCPFCGLIQVLQEPVDYYRDVIRAIAVSNNMRSFRDEYFKGFVNDYNLRNKKIIEIGCGCGEYMDIMREFAESVYGIEHKKESVDKARKNGNTAFEFFIEDSNSSIPGAPYDAFYIMNFLEHIPNLSEFLQGVYNNLSDDGVGLVEVPNGEFIVENKMFSEFMLEHLSYFSRATLRLCLESNGFEVVSCESIWHNYILSAIVRKRKPIDVSSFAIYKEEMIEKFRNIILSERDEGHKVAVWGAGHQALTLLAMAEVGDAVSCVIDSAPFKQNCLTPVSHIPIYGADKINELLMDTVVVMAGSYTDEVLNIMARDYPRVKGIRFE